MKKEKVMNIISWALFAGAAIAKFFSVPKINRDEVARIARLRAEKDGKPVDA
jgi:hypothetical protein